MCWYGMRQKPPSKVDVLQTHGFNSHTEVDAFDKKAKNDQQQEKRRQQLEDDLEAGLREVADD